MYKFIFFDQDDTLCPAKNKADNEIISLLEKLLEKYKVVITTGGMFSNIDNQILSEFSSKVNLDNLILFPTNAAKMFVFEKGKWIEKYALDFNKQEIDLITNVLNKAIIELNLKPKKVWGEIVENRAGSQITFSALGQKAPLEDKQAWDPTKEKRLEIVKYLQKDLKDYGIYACGTTSIDIVRKGIDKSYGVIQVMDLYNIDKKEILYIGDALYEGGNDYVVIKTGIDTKKVDSPDDTKKIIKNLI